MVVECRSGLDAADSVWMRGILEQVRSATWAGVVLDLSGVDDLDAAARRMVGNFHKGLADLGRALEVVADRDGARASLGHDPSIVVLQDLSELKRSIHEIAPERLQALVNGGVRNSNLLGFRLRCPVCGFDDVRGWMPDPSRHHSEWLPTEITRQLVCAGPEDALVVDAYSVAVCPDCLFSSTRLDWFDSPSLRLPACLPEGAVDRLGKTFARRRSLVQDVILETPMQVFFGMPRLDRAVQSSWALVEESLRAAGRDRASTDGFGIAVSLLMQAKFAREGQDLERYFSAAYVWLKQVVEQVGNYAEDRMAEAHVYLLSVALAMGRQSECDQIHQQIRTKWGESPEMATWTDRARELMG